MARLLRIFSAFVVCSGLLASGIGRAAADEPLHISAGSITGPLSNPIMWNILKAKGFDARHGFTLDIHLYPSIVAFYGGFTTGEVETIMGGPTNFVKLRAEAVPLQIVATGLKLSDLSIFTRDPALKRLTDLKGRTLAIDKGGSQYQMVAICARGLGMDLDRDVTLVSASFALAKAQLIASRVDAAMIAEPLATLTAIENPDVRVMFDGNEGWRALTGHDGWETVVAVREELVKRAPDAVGKLIGALQDAAAFMQSHPDEADAIVVETVKLPPGVFKQATLSGKVAYAVSPAWGDQRAGIWGIFEQAVGSGFAARLPDAGIIYSP